MPKKREKNVIFLQIHAFYKGFSIKYIFYICSFSHKISINATILVYHAGQFVFGQVLLFCLF